MCNGAQVFGKMFSDVRGACWYKNKVYQADIYRKITLVPVAFLMALSILFETVTDKKEESIIKQRVNTKIKVTLLIQCIH